MKRLLMLKSWQIFALTWGVPLLTGFIPLEKMANPLLIGSMTSFLAMILFGWYFVLGVELSRKLPQDIRITKTGFVVHTTYVAFLFLLLLAIGVFGTALIQEHASIFVLVVLYYFVAVFVIVRFVAKVLASVELKKVATASDYAGDMFLLFFSPVGIWIIQPRVRKIFS